MGKARFVVITTKAEELKALNGVSLPEGCGVVALNFEMPTDGSVPEHIELIPAGEVVQGRDGRTFLNDSPAGLSEAFAQDGKDIPVDWEHATELRAPNGLPAPAAGWIKEIVTREDGSVWGRVDWTEKGRASVAGREYRYVSPVFIFEKESRRILRITSVGLTNQPNLRLKGLNHQQKEEEMLPKELLAKLGLPENATLEQAMNAIAKIQGDLTTALNRAESPSLDKFIPRADYDAAMNRATTAEQKLVARDQADLDKEINAEVDAAVKAGKITPATVEFYKASCRAEGGMEAFRKFVEAAPVLGAPSDLDGKAPEKGDRALNAQEQLIAEMFGNSAEDLKKFGQA
ncbi:MAG: phage protease [Desulfuromonadales bacterium]|nr:phage protease [Desulfuromonadales bacterium]